MEAVCNVSDSTCRVHALAAILHSFNLYCAVISAALVCCCTSGRRHNNKWRGQNIRGIANIAVAVIWCCYAAAATLRPAETVQLVAALVAPLSWMASAILHVTIWTRLSTAPILYLAIYWLLTSASSIAIVLQYLSNDVNLNNLDIYLQSIAATFSLITSGVDMMCFYDEVRKKAVLKSSADINNCPYKHNETHFYSRITFLWLVPLLYRGYKLPLKKSDIGELPESERCKQFCNRFKSIYTKHTKTTDTEKNSIWNCFLRTVWPNFYIAGIFKVFGDICAIIPVIGLSKIIQHVENSNMAYDTKNEVTVEEFLSNNYMMLIIIILSLVLQALLSQNSTHLVTVEGTKLKIAIQNMIYNKCMRLASWSPDQEISEQSPLLQNPEDSSASQSGLLLNLMSQDTYNIMSSIWIFHYVWATPLKVSVILYLLYTKLGVSALIGTFVTLLIITPLQFLIGNRMSENAKSTSKCSDHRISKMSEILQGISVIKLYVWEDLFNEKILQLREVELKLLVKDSVYWGLLTLTIQVSTVLITVVTFTLHYVIDGSSSLTAVNIFAGLALFNQLTLSFLILPVTILMIVQAVVSSKRIHDFLELPEACNIKDDNNEEYNLKKTLEKVNDTLVDISPEDNPLVEKNESVESTDQMSDDEMNSFVKDQEYLVRFRNALFSWRMKENFWLEIDDLDIPTGKLIMVVGMSGGGKTSLLSAILGEMHQERGDIHMHSQCTMWYAGQPPWLLERSIRDNIVMDGTWCNKRYTRVVRASGLRPDLLLLPDGENTLLGPSGAPLSGGQRVRVCVARALYSRARLLMLDEPLAALDAPLAKHVVVRGLLPAARAGRTVIIATNRLELLHYADMVIVMQDGRVSGLGKASGVCEGAVGQWARLAGEARAAAARGHAGPPGGAARERAQLLRSISKLKFHDHKSEETLLITPGVGIQGVVGAHLLPEVPTCTSGTWRRSSTRRGPLYRQFSSPPLSLKRFNREVRRAVSEDAPETRKSETSTLQHIFQPKSTRSLFGWTSISLHPISKSDTENQRNQNNGNPPEIPLDSTFTSLTSNGIETTVMPIPDDPHPNEDEVQPDPDECTTWWQYARACGWWGVVYVLAAATTQALAIAADYWLSHLAAENVTTSPSDEKVWGMVVVYAWWCLGVCAAGAGAAAAGAGAGAAARRALHERLLHATLHKPLHFHLTPAATLHRFSADVHVVDKKLPIGVTRWMQLALLCIAAMGVNAVTSPWTLLALIPAFIIYITLQSVYLRNARELQHAEAESATGVLSLAAQTFAGAATVRAGRLQARMRAAFYRSLDENYNVLLLINSANRWLGLSQDLLGACCVLISLAVAVASGSSGAVTGLAGSYALLLPLYLAHAAKGRADLDLQLAAAQRVLADAAAPHEDYREDCPIPSGWQRNGKIEFQNVSVQHQETFPPVLKNINLSIESGQKIAICGRSGSGKSTLLLTCVGATKIQSGRVLVDGQDISCVPLRALRHRIVVLPQENIMFTGTLRENLDPLGVHTDEEIWQSLKAVGLYDFVHAQPAGLECGVCARRGWVGGRGARLCAARAGLRARSAAALLLDEPAAALDASAHRALLAALAASAPHTTILTVAHRIPSVRGYDAAVVLEDGRVVEQGSISALLAEPTSQLTRTLAAIHGPA